MAVLILAWAAGLPAAEGLWLPFQVPAEALAPPGVSLTSADFHDGKSLGPISRAVGRMSTGGTGFFVSGEGLILTNYHVVESLLPCLAETRDVSLQNGFLAASTAAEIPLPGLEFEVPVEATDVTDRITGQLRGGMTRDKVWEVIDEVKARLIREAPLGKGEQCRIVSFDESSRAVCLTTLRLADLRLVYLPPQALGNYGGEEDNWRMPRYTGDFAILRAWASASGEPTPPTTSSVPFHPSHHLTLKPAGLAPGAFQAVLGYPGATFRRRTGVDAAFAENTLLPARIALFSDLAAELASRIAADPAEGARLAGKLGSIHNVLKHAEGTRQGLSARSAAEKMNAAAGVDTWPPDEHAARRRAALAECLDRLSGAARRDMLLGYLTWASDEVNVAETLRRYHQERDLPEESRAPEYRPAARGQLSARLASPCLGLSKTGEKAILTVFFRHLDRLPESCRFRALDKALQDAGPADRDTAAARLAERLVNQTGLGAADERRQLLSGGDYRANRSRDPLLRFYHDLIAELAGQRRAEAALKAEADGWRRELRGRRKRSGAGEAEDANNTLRVSFGRIRELGFGPEANCWRTTLSGALLRDRRNPPLPLPEKLRQLAQERNFGPWADPTSGEMPINYACDADFSGGNSGSPVLDGDGQAVGLLFDGVLEGASTDWLYAPEARALCVDVRYIFFLLDRFAGAKALLDQLR